MKVVLTTVSSHNMDIQILSLTRRDGMHKDVIAQIMKIAPDKVVYVSCNSATQVNI
jgi:23S rRNA (uracil1939-C5)-methyltransferase